VTIVALCAHAALAQGYAFARVAPGGDFGGAEMQDRGWFGDCGLRMRDITGEYTMREVTITQPARRPVSSTPAIARRLQPMARCHINERKDWETLRYKV
jgi:hypothetical protein